MTPEPGDFGSIMLRSNRSFDGMVLNIDKAWLQVLCADGRTRRVRIAEIEYFEEHNEYPPDDEDDIDDDDDDPDPVLSRAIYVFIPGRFHG